MIGLIVVIALLRLYTLYSQYQYQYSSIMRDHNDLAVNQQTILPQPTLQPSGASAQEATTSWKTYKSNLLNFSINYPSGWFFRDDILSTTDVSNTTQHLGFSPDEITKCDFSSAQITYEPGTTFSSSEILQSLNPKISFRTITFNSGPTGGMPLRSYQFSQQGHNSIQVICYYFNNLHLQTFNQILSTFKFTDSSAPTAGQHCGGIAGIPCPDGYLCSLDGTYPDASGTCIKSKIKE